MNPEKKQNNFEPHEKIVQGNFIQSDNEVVEIDLIDLFYAMMNKLHSIIFCFLLGAVLLNAYSYFMIAPTYTSTSKIYVVSASDDSVVNLTDLNLGTSLTKDYEELILSYPLLNEVIRKLDLDMNYERLAEMIELTNPNNTRILRIKVTTTNPELSKDIANTIAEVSTEYLPETMGTIAPNIAQVAEVAEQKSGPSHMKFTLIGAILGTVLCCGVIVVQYMLDDTIRTPEDMEKYFGIVPLASIPDSDIFEEYEEPGDRKRKHSWKGFGKK